MLLNIVLNVGRTAGEKSKLILAMIESMDSDELISTILPISKVHSNILNKVVEFLMHYSRSPFSEIHKPLKSNDMKVIVGEWYGNFIDNIDRQMCYDLILAANYMDIKPLQDLACCKIATFLYNKRKYEIPAVFGVKGDFTSEEEEVVYKEYPWIKNMKEEVNKLNEREEEEKGELEGI